MNLQVSSADGTAIAVRAHAPQTGETRGVVVIGGAMGVKQDFCSPFAQWLAGQGYRVYSDNARAWRRPMPRSRASATSGCSEASSNPPCGHAWRRCCRAFQ